MMLWNRKKDFAAPDLDVAAYKEFKITEAFTFKRNNFPYGYSCARPDMAENIF